FSTEIEIATGTRWWDAGSTPLGPEGGGPEGDLDIRKMEFSLTAWVLDADELRIEGTLPVRAGFVPAGARIVFDVAGAVRTFTIDRRGRAREGDTDFRLRLRRRRGVARENPEARFRFAIRGAHLMEAFAEEGIWRPKVTANQPIVLPITVLLDGRPFRARVPLLWTVPTFGEGFAVLGPE
ncbi:MAG: hypothetical protein MUE73_11785, partial [Planctomycetes bacterium]|nr:hypothetical protein [Planctomycetota bacterium]